MPSLKVHKAISLARCDFDFEELHKWIDEDDEGLGVNHRKNRHAYNQEEEKIIKDDWNKKKGEKWGDIAVCEWLFHIVIDNLETSYKNEKRISYHPLKAYNFFKIGFRPDDPFIYYHFDNLYPEEMEEEFKFQYDFEDEGEGESQKSNDDKEED